MEKKNMKLKALKAAFPYTIPVLTGYLFLGATYGIFMKTSGFPFWYPMLMSLTIFAGSMQFVAVNILLGVFNPIQALLMTFMINARHIFYGISMLSRYKGMGWKKIYLIFGLSDETFSVNCSAEIPVDVDKGWFLFFVTLLDQFYWFFGSTMGGIFGSVISFSTEGLDFVLTALFVVIFLEQLLKGGNKICAAIGVVVPIICLMIFGADDFMIPAMLAMLGVLILLRGTIEKSGETA